MLLVKAFGNLITTLNLFNTATPYQITEYNSSGNSKLYHNVYYILPLLLLPLVMIFINYSCNHF